MKKRILFLLLGLTAMVLSGSVGEGLDSGAARLLALEAGIVAEILAKEGDEVQAGQPLIRLSFERGTASGVTSGELVQREISERIAGLEREQLQARQLGAQQTEILRRKVDDLQRELTQFDAEIKAQQSRLASSRNEFQRAEELFKDKFYSESKLIEFRNNVHDQQVKLEAALRKSLPFSLTGAQERVIEEINGT